MENKLLKQVKIICLWTGLFILISLPLSIYASHKKTPLIIGYLGGFGGITMPIYQFNAVYENPANSAVLAPAYTSAPISGEGGADVGFIFNYFGKYAAGIEYNFVDYGHPNSNSMFHIDGMTNANNAFDITQRLELNYTNDLMAVLGLSVGQHAHLFIKIGVSYANILSQLSTFALITRSNSIDYDVVELDLTGAVVGLNLSIDLTKHFGVFAEYMYRSYPRKIIQPDLTNLNPLNSAPDSLSSRSVTVNANSVRFGANIYIY